MSVSRMSLTGAPLERATADQPSQAGSMLRRPSAAGLGTLTQTPRAARRRSPYDSAVRLGLVGALSADENERRGPGPRRKRIFLLLAWPSKYKLLTWPRWVGGMLLRPGGGQGPRWGGDAAPPRRSGRAGSKTPAGYSSGIFMRPFWAKS